MHPSNVLSAWTLAAHDTLARASEGAGLDQRQLGALTLVAEHEGCSIDWLSRRVGLTHPGTVRLVDRLQAAGLVERRRSGREVGLSLTPGGRAALARWREARDAAVADLLAGLDASERDALTASLAAALSRRPRSRPEADAVCRSCEWPACGPDCPVDRSVAVA